MNASISRLNEYNKQEVIKHIKRRSKVRTQLIKYLEDEICFRDYRIMPAHLFGKVHVIGVHMNLSDDMFNFHHAVDDALHSFNRDGFPQIIFYI